MLEVRCRNLPTGGWWIWVLSMRSGHVSRNHWIKRMRYLPRGLICRCSRRHCMWQLCRRTIPKPHRGNDLCGVQRGEIFGVDWCVGVNCLFELPCGNLHGGHRRRCVRILRLGNVSAIKRSLRMRKLLGRNVSD